MFKWGFGGREPGWPDRKEPTGFDGRESRDPDNKYTETQDPRGLERRLPRGPDRTELRDNSCNQPRKKDPRATGAVPKKRGPYSGNADKRDCTVLNRNESRGCRRGPDRREPRGPERRPDIREPRGPERRPDIREPRGPERYPDRRERQDYSSKQSSVRDPRATRAIPKNGGPPLRKWVLGFKKLQELEGKTPSEAMFYLKSENSGLKELLNQTDMFKDKIIAIWSVIAISCRCDQRENLADLLKTVNDCNSFTVTTLQHFLLGVQNGRCQPEEVRTLENVTAFLENLHVLHPSTTLSTMTLILPILKDTVKAKLSVAGQGLLDRLERLEEIRNTMRERYSIQFEPSVVAIDSQEPTDNFRDIPIIPDRSDVITNARPFLRPNIISGRYRDVDHYLDIQFRLLREDFVRPLREGVSAYLQNVKQGVQKKLQEIKLYKDVVVQKSIISEAGVVHQIQFPLLGNLANVHWENSKRLIFGSLLCLSNDGFETMLFGTVAFRDIKDLKDGKICVRFENKDLLEIDKDYTKVYVMIETDSYFEAYRHILSALQEVTESTFPLKEYIVDVEKDMKSPKYAENTDQVYCFGPLIRSKSTKDVPLVESKGFACCFEKRNVRIHRQLDWSEHDMGLDESQKNALKSALTQRLSIIQGPPGTGKTFVGLKIVELLLHNHNVWAPARDKCPILIVCYTNHALDQFLEGILKTTDKIVRIGGRSKCEALDRFNLSQLRRQVNNYVAHDYTLRTKREIEKALQDVSTRMSKIEKLKKAAYGEVLAKPELFEHIRETHLRSLKIDGPSYLLSVDTHTVLGFWLGVDVEHNFNDVTFVLEKDQTNTDFDIPMEAEANQDEISGSEDEIDIAKPYEDDTYENNIMESKASVSGTDKSTSHNVEEQTHAATNNQQDHVNIENDNQAIAVEEIDAEEFKDAVDVEFLQDQRMVDDDFQDVKLVFHTRNDLGNDEQIEQGDSEWKTQGGKKQLKKTITKRLKCTAMTEVELDFCENVWNLKPQDRWRLYRCWLDSLIEKCDKEIQDCRKDYERQLLLSAEVRHERERIVINDAEVVGLTTTGAAKFKHLIRGMRSKIVIVEEAAEVLEAHIVTALNECTQHLILIGDHQQLRPNPTVYELAKKYNLEVSLFERMIANGLPYCRLGIQHRMKPCISKLLVPNIYTDLVDHPSVQKYEAIKGLDKSMYFISHTVNEYHSQDSTSRINTHEIDYLIELCRYLMLQGYHPSRITILTTYLAQLFALKRRMTGTLKEVRVSVVDNFQGEENDIILISFVRSNEEGAIGFLKTENRVCVSLSRAKQGLYCIGNFQLLASKSKLWQNICTDLETQDALGPALNIKCQNHKNLVPVTTASDFFQISDGGCLDPCDFRLECGHVCSRKCHPDDQEHVNYTCKKPCNKTICELNHQCPKQCWEDCGGCTVFVDKVIPKCGHKAKIPCFKDPELHICRVPCVKLLNCDHPCTELCGKPCGSCFVVVSAKSPCGHNVRIQCRYSKDSPLLLECCHERCTRGLDCGHACPNRCGMKCATSCRVLVTYTLRCGHVCEVPCYEVEIAKSAHWKFAKPYDLTDNCFHSVLELNITSTSNMISNALIRRACTDLNARCKKACNKELICGHKCKGTCGECYQGRIHVICKEICGKTLACGHPCRYPCANSCPPCTYPCENRCVHSRCTSVCGAPCTPCMEPCAWRCKHQRCLQRCSESCDRPPCNRPCWRKLRCGHKCIGMCGEPCPQLCRFCHREEVTSIFFGDEDHPKARFLQLEDCGHIFEIRGFTKWINGQQQSNSEIQMITCPLCKRAMRKNLRFNNSVKNSIATIEKIKTKVFGMISVNLQTRKRLQNKLELSNIRKSSELHPKSALPSTDPCPILEVISSQLSAQKVNLYQRTLSLYENYCRFSDKNADTVSKLKRLEGDSSVSAVYSDVCDFIGETLQIMISKTLNAMEKGSEQLMDDFVSEYERLSLILNFVTSFKHAFVSQETKIKFKITETMEVLFLRTYFGEQEKSKFLRLRDELKALCSGITILGVTDEERLSIIRAMGLKQGHWYQCPNGHVYCITECGGAMVESRCNECNAVIGGGSHRLRGDNRVATAMDGARHSAWPTQANMANYDLQY